MNKEDLEKTLKYFHKRESKFYNPDTVSICYGPVKMKGYYHHDEEDFCITILDDKEDSVFQVGTEADTIGVELKTFDDLRIRFKSFTGEELEN